MKYFNQNVIIIIYFLKFNFIATSIIFSKCIIELKGLAI